MNRIRRGIAPTGDEKETEMSFTKSKRLIATALLLTLGSAGSVFAQQSSDSAGMVRIRSPRTSSMVRPVSGQTVQQAGGHRMGVVEAPCQSGNCPTGNGYQVGGCPSGNCPTGNCPGGCPGGCFHGKFGEHYCKHSPDYGYSPPAKYPLHRRGVEYTNYYPQNWYGAGADYSGSYAPMVYQPTDTTQLGYHYQHVPFWQPMPNRLPPRPIPAQWHITAPPVQASRYGNGAWAAYAGPHFGHHGRSYSAVNSSCPPAGVSTQLTPANPTPAKPTAPQALDGEVVPPIEASPLPVELDSGSASLGAEPGALPPMPTSSSADSGIPSLNKTPVPANAAVPGNIRRF